MPAGLVAFAYLSYLAGVVVSPLAGRLSARVDRRARIALGLLIALAGVGLTLVPHLTVIVAALFVLCSGFTAQAVAPAFVNTSAATAKGGAGALYLSFYCVGGALGAALPGLAWQSLGWPGVTAACAMALLLALVSDWLLCRD